MREHGAPKEDRVSLVVRKYEALCEEGGFGERIVNMAGGSGSQKRILKVGRVLSLMLCLLYGIPKGQTLSVYFFSQFL